MSYAIVPILLMLMMPRPASAHCPLCTAGTGILAVFAASIGVDPAVIGVFVGAAAVAMGLWLAKYIKRRFLPGQNLLLGAFSYVTTILPMTPLFDDQRALDLYLVGEYGSLLNRTYLFNPFVLGTLIGGGLLLAAPALSRALTRVRRGTTMPFQGMLLTFGTLAIAAVTLQLSV